MHDEEAFPIMSYYQMYSIKIQVLPGFKKQTK